MWYQIRSESARVRSAEGPQNLAQRLLFEHFKARHVVGVDSDEERNQMGHDVDTGGETAGSEYGSSAQSSLGSMRSSMRDILSGVSRAASSTKTKMRRMRRRNRRAGDHRRDGNENDEESSSDDDNRMLRSTARSGIRTMKLPRREQRIIRVRETYNPDDYD